MPLRRGDRPHVVVDRGPWRRPIDERGRPRLYADIAHPINQHARDFVQGEVIAAFRKEIERSKEDGYVAPTFDDLDYEYYDESEV